MSCAAPRNKKNFARFTVETQPIALFYDKTMKLFCFYFGKSSYLCSRKNNKIRFKMNTRKKFFKSKREACKEAAERRESASSKYRDAHVFNMPKGSRHVGQFFVGSEIEYLNAD